MGLSVSAAGGIIFTVFIVSVSALYLTIIHNSDSINEAEDAWIESVIDRKGTAIMIENMTYDPYAKQLSVFVFNNGTSTLKKSKTDILINGTLYNSNIVSSKTVIRIRPLVNTANIIRSDITTTQTVISWVTDERCVGEVHCDTDRARISAGTYRWQARDSIERHTGVIRATLTGLSTDTTYYYEVVSYYHWDDTTSGMKIENNSGNYHSFKTAKAGTNPTNCILTGIVRNSTGGFVKGAIVYVSKAGSERLSSVTDANGRWSVELKNLKDTNGDPLNFNQGDLYNIVLQGGSEGYTTSAYTLLDPVANPIQNLGVGTLALPNPTLLPDSTTDLWTPRTVLKIVVANVSRTSVVRVKVVTENGLSAVSEDIYIYV